MKHLDLPFSRRPQHVQNLAAIGKDPLACPREAPFNENEFWEYAATPITPITTVTTAATATTIATVTTFTIETPKAAAAMAFPDGSQQPLLEVAEGLGWGEMWRPHITTCSTVTAASASPPVHSVQVSHLESRATSEVFTGWVGHDETGVVP